MIFRRKDTVTTHAAINADGATRVDASLRMPHGILQIGGGAAQADLMEATFVTPEGREPQVDYRVTGEHGSLTVTQPNHFSSNGTNDWDVRFGEHVPLALALQLSAGKLTADLSQVPLTSLQVKQSAGQSTLNLDGDQVFLTGVDIDQSAGELDLSMPGTYPLLRSIDVQSSAGDIRLDLRGVLLQDVSVSVRTSAGSIEVLLPDSVNVHAHVRTTVGSVRAHGLVRGDGGWVSDGPRSGPCVSLAVRATAGQITLQQGTGAGAA